MGDLARVLTTLGDVLSEEETQELLTKADLDGDGNLNYDEFITLLFKVGITLITSKVEVFTSVICSGCYGTCDQIS